MVDWVALIIKFAMFNIAINNLTATKVAYETDFNLLQCPKKLSVFPTLHSKVFFMHIFVNA